MECAIPHQEGKILLLYVLLQWPVGRLQWPVVLLQEVVDGGTLLLFLGSLYAINMASDLKRSCPRNIKNCSPHIQSEPLTLLGMTHIRTE